MRRAPDQTATLAPEQRGEQAVQMAHELKDRIARERRTVRAIKDHLLAAVEPGGASDERVQAPTRSAPELLVQDDWYPLGECLRVRRGRFGPDAVCLELAGEVDLSGSLRLRQLVTDVLEGGARQLSLDLGQVSFMDSNGLSALLWVRRRAMATEAAFWITAVHPQLLRLLHITKLDAILLTEPGGRRRSG